MTETERVEKNCSCEGLGWQNQHTTQKLCGLDSLKLQISGNSRTDLAKAKKTICVFTVTCWKKLGSVGQKWFFFSILFFITELMLDGIYNAFLHLKSTNI